MPQRVLPTTEGQAERASILDAIGVPQGWEQSTAAGLIILLEQSPNDTAVLPDLFEGIGEELPLLRRASTGFRREDALRTSGQVEQHRVPALLNALAANIDPPTLALRLIAIAAAFAIRTESEAQSVAQIASAVLNGDGPKARALTAHLSSVAGISDLIFKYEDLRRGWKGDDDIPHRSFEVLWQRSLYERLKGAVLAAALRDETYGIDPNAMLDLEEPDAFLHVPLVDGGMEDEAPDIGLESYPERQLGQPAMPDHRPGLAKAHLLGRRSFANVCRRPDDIIPVPRLRQAIVGANRYARTAMASGRLDEAIDMIGLQIVAVTACRVSELPRIVIGDSPTVDTCALDIESGTFLRYELRPSGAFNPKPGDQRWLETGGSLVTRLPDALLDQIRELCQLRGAADGSQPLNLATRIQQGSEQTNAMRVIHVADALELVVPGIHVGANALRARLAAYMTAELGQDAAQIALGDSFGIPTSAAYYYRSQSSTFTDAMWKYALDLYGNTTSSVSPRPPGRGHYVGSRAAISNERLQQRAVATTPAGISGTEVHPGWREWKDRVERSATALVYATGQRINDSLGEMTIDDVCPEYGLVALWDKPSTVAHAVRLAALGHTALNAMRDYVAFLARVERHGQSNSELASRILRGTLPLFTMPTAQGHAAMDIDAFVKTLLGDLADRPNVLRHHLDQALADASVDPTLRHQQLGWFTIPATALGVGSPLSAIDFSAQLSPFIDQYMGLHGWAVPQVATGVGWRDVPLQPLENWDAAEKKHMRSHRNVSRKTNAQVMEQKERVLTVVRPKFQEAISALAPGLRLSSRHWTLERTTQDAPAPEVNKALALAILNHVVAGDNGQSVPFVARVELARVLTHANTHGIARAYIPAYQKFNFTSEPSPFLKGFAPAVRHAEWLRDLVRTDAEWHMAHRESSARACRVLLGLVLLTPYRTFDLARQIVESAARATRGRYDPSIVRVPLGRSHVVLTGEAALLVGEWARQGWKMPAQSQVAKFLYAKLKPIIDSRTTRANVIKRVEGLARTAGRVELNGPERAFLLQDFTLNVVDMPRALANSEGWPLRCAETSTDDAGGKAGLRAGAASRSAASASRTRVGKVIRLLNPDLELVLPFTEKKLPKDTRGRESIVRGELDFVLKDREILNVGRAVTEYARFVIAPIHEKGSKEGQLSTAHTYVSRFAKPLADALGDADLAVALPEDITEAYSAVLLSKPLRGTDTRKGNYRRQVYDALRRFHDWLRAAHDLDDVEWQDLAAIAGERFNGVDPGLVRQPELHAVLAQLERESDALASDLNCNPDARIEREQAALFAVLLAAGRCRPSSVHGLTFGDLHITDDGDWIHVRRTGIYGTAKTAASLGFHRLAGAEWQRARTRWVDWVAEARKRLGDGLEEYPIFGCLNDPRQRRPRPRLTARLGELLRWATGSPDAHPYWLRKSGIIAAHGELWAAGKAPTPLDVQCQLAENGHIHPLTALGSYLHDAVVIFAAYLQALPHLTANIVIQLTRVKRGAIETAWQRAKPAGESVREMAESQRTAIALGCVGFKPAEAPAEHITDPPPINAKVDVLRCSNVSEFLRELQTAGVVGIASARAGFTKKQAERILDACARWYERTGHGLANESSTRAIRAPRPVAGSSHLTDVLDEADPTAMADWLILAEHWSLTLRRAPLRAGLPLVDRVDRGRAEAVLAQIGLVTIVDEQQQTLKPVRLGASKSSPDDKQPALTLWPAMAWTLAIIWIARESQESVVARATEQTPGASSDDRSA